MAATRQGYYMLPSKPEMIMIGQLGGNQNGDLFNP